MLALFEFEVWISSNLGCWMTEAMKSPSELACAAVSNVASSYEQHANVTYADSPEQFSIMILILAELWRAMNLLATTLLP